MKHNPKTVASALGAFMESIPDANEKYNREEFRFNDDRLKYQLNLLPNNNAAFLAADPDEPVQGCPMFEFSFRCTDIVVGRSAYDDGNEVAVRFYENEISIENIRLTMTWRNKGYWYVWANAEPNPYPLEQSDGQIQ